MWQVRVVTYEPKDVTDLLDEEALAFVDEASRSRLQRFYKVDDTFRGLIGCLLPRMLLSEIGVPRTSMTFGKTPEGKPYINGPDLPHPVGYNITHDDSVIAMVHAIGEDLPLDPPAHKLGIDIMRLTIPRGQKVSDFILIFKEQLTDFELNLLPPKGPLAEEEIIRRFFLIWTLKEAYTKALGLGLGFDFKRIEYDVPQNVVLIDGSRPLDWRFSRFDICVGAGDCEQKYVGMVARVAAGRSQSPEDCEVEVVPSAKLEVYEARGFLHRAKQQFA